MNIVIISQDEICVIISHVKYFNTVNSIYCK